MLKLKEARNKSGYKQAEIAKMLGVTQSAYSSWETGRTSVNNKDLKKLSEILGVSTDYLLDEDETGREWTAIPVIGHITAGRPDVNAVEVIGDEYIAPSMAATGEYFALKIKGDSMAPRMLDGDIAIVRKQAVCNSGDIAVVRFNKGYYTVKKIKRINTGIMLIPWNTVFDPVFYSFDMMEKHDLQIVGRIVELRCKM